MPARPPYAIATKMIPLIGFLRFELNRPMKFANITESSWGSIYRRSLVIKLRGKFAPKSEIRGLPGVFAKDDTLKEFLESKSAASVFLRILLNHMNRYTFEESAAMIDEYARAPGGVTWSTMRFACRLPPEVQDEPTIASSIDPCPYAEERNQLRELSDALACASVERDMEVQDTPSSLGALWKQLAPPNKARAPQGDKIAKDYFARMITEGMWIPHGKSYKGCATYCPALEFEGRIRDIYREGDFASEPVLPDVANVDAISRYVASDARWGNALILKEFYKRPNGRKDASKGGRLRKTG